MQEPYTVVSDLLAGEDPKLYAVFPPEFYGRWQAFVRELGEATVAELACHTGQDRGNVHRRVQKLHEQGMIERHVTQKAIVYRVRSQLSQMGIDGG